MEVKNALAPHLSTKAATSTNAQVIGSFTQLLIVVKILNNILPNNNILFCFLDFGKWDIQDKKFCPKCDVVYETLAEAKLACAKDNTCRVIYDLFCDNKGYFCTCPMWSVRVQTHPKGVDCIHVKVEEKKRKQRKITEHDDL